MTGRYLFFLCFSVFLTGYGINVHAVPSSDDLEKLQAQIKEEQQTHRALQRKAQDVATEVSGVQKKMVKAAETVQDFEETLTQLEKKRTELEEEESKINARLMQRQSQLVKMMSALQKMAINPPETLFFQPDDPIRTLRSSLLLKEGRAPLQAQTEKLRQDLDTLASLQAALRAQASQIKVASKRLEDEKSNMEKLMKQKFILQTHFEAESQQAKQKSIELGKQAKDLQDLLQKLDRERRKTLSLAHKQKPIFNIPMPARNDSAFYKSKGNLPLPARGRIIQTYGEKLESGLTTKGLTLQTRSAAQVVAPFDGTVLFAGPFKSYGNLLIVEHGEGYHSLLAGLGTINANVGQNILTGEPVGNMSTNGTQKLYIEFRKDGQPINPLDWFAAKQQKGKNK